MSVSLAIAPAERTGSGLAARLAWIAAALTIAAGLLAGLAWLVVPTLTAPIPRSPFSVGFREAAPVATGVGGWLLALQASFSQSLQAAVGALKRDGAWTPIVLLGLAYGVFHAAGPGHGKAVIAGYIVAGERTLRRGFALSFAAALLQALVAITIVWIGVYLLNVTAPEMTRAGTVIETVSFFLVAVIGAVVTWRKAGQLAGARAEAACGSGCGHVSLADAAAIERLESWQERLGVVLAAGIRPCAGAVLILVFSASQGMLAAGIAATIAMAFGTALTTGLLASLAVFVKRLALRLAGGRGQAGARAIGGLELVAAAFVLVLGLALLAGLATGGRA